MINRSAHPKRRAYAGWQRPAVLGLIDSEGNDTIAHFILAQAKLRSCATCSVFRSCRIEAYEC